jgi:phage tail sheath protein FI
MAFQVSPGVAIREIDLTNVVPAVSTSIGAVVITGTKGPIEEIVTITSEKELVDMFGVPTDDTAAYFFNAAAFLKYGNNLKVVRAASSGAKNATAGTSGAGTGLLIKNRDHYDTSYSRGEATQGSWAARYAGALGNAIKVSYVTSETAFDTWEYAGLFDSAPGTSGYATSKNGSHDEMHIVVVDATGAITGVADTVLEKFAYVSQASDAKKFDGTSNYYKNVITNTSSYIWQIDHPTELTNAGSTAGRVFTTSTTVHAVTLAGGTDGSAVTEGNIDTAYQVFNDAETVDVNLLIGAPTLDGADGVTQANNLLAIAENRNDVIAFVSPPVSATAASTTPKESVLTFVDQLTSTSYGFVDSTAVKIYDKYNDVYRWINCAGHMAGLCANTDNVADAWFSPGGFTRGQLLGITKVAFNPKKAERDDLYKKRVNPIVSFPGEGTVLFGDKTLLAKPSAFDRINVRRLFIVLEKAISTAAKYQLFELNDEFTRAMFRNMTEPFLREIKGRRGITDFKVVCDETNNTGEIIDSNQFVADIYIKPARSINFITLNFIATRTGVDFAEIGG